MSRYIAVAIILMNLLAGNVEASPTCKPVPIEEAVRIGHGFARKWRPRVEVLRVDTAHPPREWEESTVPPGLDGGRCVWNLEFKDTKTHQFIMFRVANGSVTDLARDAGMNTGKGFPPESFRVSGKDLAQKARDAGILPAKPPGTAGYSYYLNERGHGLYEVHVVGEDPKGRHAGIRVDPTTGAILADDSP